MKEVLARCAKLDKAAEHVRDFGDILTDHLGSTLPTWIDAVDTSQLPGLTGFALHLLRDLDAVTVGLTLDWSSGSIEGAVNRIKEIKRQLYGRRIRTTPQDEPAPVTLRDAPKISGMWTGPSRCPAVAGWPHVDPKGRCRVGVPRPSAQSGGGHDGSIRSWGSTVSPRGLVQRSARSKTRRCGPTRSRMRSPASSGLLSSLDDI
ncbi:transposase [Streptomyces sasae]|uniref:transposase n=1 Tax=Streptomyces sasae TaxID=1266772 RepID=UPI0029310165|nr:transposase [Streptomyces sasae]